MQYEYWIDNIYYNEPVSNQQKTNVTIFQKCSQKGLDIPCFCYHESLTIAGNCRMCLVEISTSMKLVVSCAMPMQNNVKIFTLNYRVKKARESVLEFLLVNHPLDCPICDQGGECDPQDITLVYGSDRSRFYEYNKRSVFDKECGSFVKMIMTRCIHCTRCIRFLTEIADNYDYGMLNRGNNSEITTYIKKSLNDELSANIIDLCPVGALTSKPFLFSARAWELNSIESIDIFDSIGSSIRIDYLNNKIYRILPIYNKFINEDWITNKIRFSYDCQKTQRLYYPLIKILNNYISINWNDSFFLFLKNFFNYFLKNEIYSFFGDFNDVLLIINMKKFFDFIGLEINNISNFYLNIDSRFNFFFNNNFENMFNIVILNLNLRIEMPILNLKLKNLFKKNKFNIFFFGLKNNKNDYIITNNILSKFISSKNNMNIKIFYNKNIFNLYYFKLKLNTIKFIVGLNYFINNNYYQLSLLNYFLLKNLFNLNIDISISNISYLNYFEIGLKFNKYLNYLNKFNNSFLFLQNIDNAIFLNILKKTINSFIIYSGSFFDFGAKIAHLILPISMFFEYNGIFLNFEGKYRKSIKVIDSLHFLYSPSDLFKFLFIYINLKFIKYFYISKDFFKFFKFFKFLKFNFYILKFFNFIKYFNLILNIVIIKQYKNNLFKTYLYNFYKIDGITRNSKNLSLASIEYLKNLTILN